MQRADMPAFAWGEGEMALTVLPRRLIKPPYSRCCTTRCADFLVAAGGRCLQCWGPRWSKAAQAVTPASGPVLELLSAAYALSPLLAMAEILEIGVASRPAFRQPAAHRTAGQSDPRQWPLSPTVFCCPALANDGGPHLILDAKTAGEYSMKLQLTVPAIRQRTATIWPPCLKGRKDLAGPKVGQRVNGSFVPSHAARDAIP